MGAKKKEKFKIKYDPMDISLIHVYDSRANDYLPVPAVDQDYTTGLTLWQHKVIKREARDSAEEYVDIVELCLAKDRIKKMVAEGFNAQSKSETNVRAALWLGIGQTQNGSLEVSNPESDGNHNGSDSLGNSFGLNPQTDPSAGISNFPSAMTAKSGEDANVEIEDNTSGVVVASPTVSKNANPGNSNRRRSKDATSSMDLESQSLQENLSPPDQHSTETMSHPTTPTVEKDLRLEGWESGYDLPRRRQ